MKKKIALPLLILIIGIVLFVPAEQQESLTIKKPFLKVYDELLQIRNWKKWRTDLNENSGIDTGHIKYQGSLTNHFLKVDQKRVSVIATGNEFYIQDSNGSKTKKYKFSILPGKDLNNTILIIEKTGQIWNYLINKFNHTLAKVTYADRLRDYLETDSLYYGGRIKKLMVPNHNLVVIRRSFLKGEQFMQAKAMLAELKLFIRKQHVLQQAPVIAQFLPNGKDSVQVNIGMFINKTVTADHDINMVTMPQGGPLYTMSYNGPFKGRMNVYANMDRYLKDHFYQQAIQPFETYLDDQLPSSDTDQIKIVVNFTSFN